MKKVYLFAILFGASMAFTACGSKGENKECCKEGENKECCKEGENKECCKEAEEHKCCKEAEEHKCCKEAAEEAAPEAEITLEEAAAQLEELAK